MITNLPNDPMYGSGRYIEMEIDRVERTMRAIGDTEAYFVAHTRLIRLIQSRETAQERRYKWTITACFAIVYWGFILGQVVG